MSAGNWKVKLWCAVHDYAKACGGTPDLLVYGNTERQNAVTALESSILEGEQETKLKLAAAEAELSQSFELAESQLYAEKLAGNIVKEEFWKGELSALHRIRKTIQGKADK